MKAMFCVFIVLVFFGALLWSREQDPFFRNWFTLKTIKGESVRCVVVLPKPIRHYPIVIFAHDSGGTVMNDGKNLRQMAELGLASVSFEYNQSNEAIFTRQFESVLNYLDQQKWVNTNAIAWVGISLGANRMFDFALQHTNQLPQLMVQLSGGGITEGSLTPTTSTNSHPMDKRITGIQCPLFLVHGEEDEVYPVTDIKRLSLFLQTNKMPVKLKILPGLQHNLEPERVVIFRCIGEYCLSQLAGTNALKDYHSIARWQAGSPPLWLFWLPALFWLVGWFVCSRSFKANLPEKIKKKSCGVTSLRCLAVLLAICALAETTIHMVPQYLAVTDNTLSIARRFLVQTKERADFEFLASQPIWRGQELGTLLDHVELAGYNREIINWQMDQKIYQNYVLSPTITGGGDEQLNWRRPLWEEFYPRIRHETSPEDAAKIVVRHLRERVTIATLSNLSHQAPDIWLKQITDETGFKIIYVAALRAVGVPARLDSNNHAEFWDGARWQNAPAPSVISL
jgi:predicted esterase